MQTEIEKYEQIHHYLKGQLSGEAKAAFEEAMKSDANLEADVAMHRMVNEAIVDNYLLDVKASARKVMRQKARNNAWRNWGLGIGAVMLSGSIWMLSVQENPKQAAELPTKTRTEISVTKPNEMQLNQTKQQPTQLNRKLTNQAKLQEKRSKSLDATTKPNFIFDEETKNEQVRWPMEDDFNGELQIFGQDGKLVFQQTITNGMPNQWDGLSQSGSQLSAGQYGFVLKTLDGRLVKHGFVTVLR